MSDENEHEDCHDECGECSGTGGCVNCGGDIEPEDCDNCDGSEECPECNGTGEWCE